jgi:putative transposase
VLYERSSRSLLLLYCGYLRAYEDVPEARQSIGRYLDFYNGRRPHTALDRRTPDQAYFNPLPLRTVA